MELNFSVCIPTLNASRHFNALLPALQQQSRKPDRILVIDSASEDDTVRQALEFGAEVLSIKRSDFNHGGTRQVGLEQLSSEIVLFLTQDAVPANPLAFEQLVKAFEDDTVAVAYGRQLPRSAAGPFERHARLFNYPGQSYRRRFADRSDHGLKTVFCSDSFAAYRRTSLLQLGGFQRQAFFGEDMIAAATLVQAGWTLAYVAEAEVVHSHDYSVLEEFRRAVDIGIFHQQEHWLIETFGRPQGLGMRFVKFELEELLHEAPHLIPAAVFRSAAKYLGYMVGTRYRRLPVSWLPRLSSQPFYWMSQSVPSAAV